MSIITNATLIIAYCTGLGPISVDYTIDASNIVQMARANISFKDDKQIEKVASNYLNSGYDRGHLAPAADFTTDRNTLEATYLMSNISPMFPKFNRGKWAQIEGHARDLVFKHGSVKIKTIPVYGDTTNYCGNLVVPTAFIKMVYTGDVCIAAWCAENKRE